MLISVQRRPFQWTRLSFWSLARTGACSSDRSLLEDAAMAGYFRMVGLGAGTRVHTAPFRRNMTGRPVSGPMVKRRISVRAMYQT